MCVGRIGSMPAKVSYAPCSERSRPLRSGEGRRPSSGHRDRLQRDSSTCEFSSLTLRGIGVRVTTPSAASRCDDIALEVFDAYVLNSAWPRSFLFRAPSAVVLSCVLGHGPLCRL